jgi:hypothetical protein
VTVARAFAEDQNKNRTKTNSSHVRTCHHALRLGPGHEGQQIPLKKRKKDKKEKVKKEKVKK